MKSLLISATVIAMLLNFSAAGQYSATRLCNETIKLNGGVRSQFGGISRTYIPVTVPTGATHIAISITVSPTQQVNGYALTANLVSVFAAGNVFSIPDMLSSLQGSPGTGIIDLVLYNSGYCVDQFIQKSQNLCNALYWRQNSGGGIFHFEVPYPGQYYLCFRNPSEMDAVYFHVEATAIIAADSEQKNYAAPTENSGETNYMRIRYQNEFLNEQQLAQPRAISPAK